MPDDLGEALEVIGIKLSEKQKKNWWSGFQPRHLKLHVIKAIINYTTPRLNSLVRQQKATLPETLIFEAVLDQTTAEAQTIKQQSMMKDQNFVNLLKSVKNAVIYVAEQDPYYLEWLRFFLLSMFNTTKDKLSILAQDKRGDVVIDNRAL